MTRFARILAPALLWSTAAIGQVPPAPAPLRIVVTPPTAPNRLGRVQVQGDFKSVVVFFTPRSSCDFAKTSDPRTFVVAADPGVTLDVLAVVQTNDGLLDQAVATMVMPGATPPPAPPGPSPTPAPAPPAPTPVDPDIVILGSGPPRAAADAPPDQPPPAAVPATTPLLAIYCFDRDNSTAAQVSLQTDRDLLAALKSSNAAQRNYDAPRTRAELTGYGFDSWIAKYGTPAIFWQTPNGVIVAVTKNPTPAKAVATLRAVRGQ